MRLRQNHHLYGAAALALLLAAVPSCGREVQRDWKNCEVSWRYGPTTGTARREHLLGTGTEGPGKMSKGWNFQLRDGKHLTMRPFELAPSHALFGKSSMIVTLFDQRGNELETVRSGTITADNATFSFEVTEAAAKRLHEVVIWYGKG